MNPRVVLFLTSAALLAAPVLRSQVTFDRITGADKEPQNWLTYSGGVASQRFTKLDQITPENVKNLELQWIYQAKSLEKLRQRLWLLTVFSISCRHRMT